jgi:hypothetical protein
VATATGYGMDSWGSTPRRGKRFASTSRRPDRALELTQPPTQWVLGALSLGLKRLGREAYYPPPSNAEVKIGGAISPLPHTSSWRGALLFKYGDSFTLLLQRKCVKLFLLLLEVAFGDTTSLFCNTTDMSDGWFILLSF